MVLELAPGFGFFFYFLLSFSPISYFLYFLQSAVSEDSRGLPPEVPMDQVSVAFGCLVEDLGSCVVECCSFRPPTRTVFRPVHGVVLVL